MLRERATIFTTGVLFAIMQFGFFFLVESEVSATVLTYFAVTAAWLVGLIVGLWVASERMFKVAPFAALAAFFALWAVVRLLPFALEIVPLLALLVAVAGAYAGVFFQRMSTRANDVRTLLLDENNGFIAGIVVAVAGFAAAGLIFFVVAPVLLVATLFALSRAP